VLVDRYSRQRVADRRPAQRRGQGTGGGHVLRARAGRPRGRVTGVGRLTGPVRLPPEAGTTSARAGPTSDEGPPRTRSGWALGATSRPCGGRGPRYLPVRGGAGALRGC